MRPPTARRCAPHARIFCEVEEPVDFERSVQDAIDSLPEDLNDFMSTSRSSSRTSRPTARRCSGSTRATALTADERLTPAVPPDKISIYQGPLERLYGADPARLRAEIRRVVLHEIAAPLRISDERLRELDRY